MSEKEKVPEKVKEKPKVIRAEDYESEVRKKRFKR